MKKTLFIAFLLLIFIFESMTHAYASSNHYLPGGKNYISNNNLVFNESEEKMSSANPILVKPETDYILSFTRDYDTQSLSLQVQCYDNHIEGVILTPSKNDMLVDGEMKFYYHFKTPEDCNYISFELDDFGYSGTDPSTDVDLFLQLEEGLEPTAYETYIEGSMIDTTSPYFQSSGTIISYVDQPISTTEIQNSLVAYDTIDGDVSNNISLLTDGYTNSMDTIGTYTIIFEVSDASSNTSQVHIKVEVVDVLAPVFSDVSEITSVYPNVYTVEDILGMLSASDNYEGDISSSINLVEDNYSSNANIVGDYSMTFNVIDGSGNEATHNLNVHVIDEQAPLITGDSTITIGYNQYYEENQLLSNLSVTDNYDSNVQIIIENNDYKNYSDLIGNYDVLFSATDSSGNRSEKTITIHVVDEIGPMVYLDSSVIQVYSNTILQLPDFAHLLRKTNELDPSIDYRIIVRYDSYTKHASKPGTYHMRLTFKDNQDQALDKDFEIKVIDKQINDIVFAEQTHTPNFYETYKPMIIYGGIGTLFTLSQIIWFYVYRKKNI